MNISEHLQQHVTQKTLKKKKKSQPATHTHACTHNIPFEQSLRAVREHWHLRPSAYIPFLPDMTMLAPGPEIQKEMQENKHQRDCALPFRFSLSLSLSLSLSHTHTHTHTHSHSQETQTPLQCSDLSLTCPAGWTTKRYSKPSHLPPALTIAAGSCSVNLTGQANRKKKTKKTKGIKKNVKTHLIAVLSCQADSKKTFR